MIRELHEAVLADPPFFDQRLVHVKGDARYFTKLVRRLIPKLVVELGTGVGRTAAQVMAVLPRQSRFITINWPNPPSGDDVGRELRPWRGDPRLTEIKGDTRDKTVIDRVPDGVDLLYVDSGTTHACEETWQNWEHYRPKLANGAVVVIDDIDFPGSDMRQFWNPLGFEKIEIELCGHAAGMFQYRTMT